MKKLVYIPKQEHSTPMGLYACSHDPHVKAKHDVEKEEQKQRLRCANKVKSAK